MPALPEGWSGKQMPGPHPRPTESEHAGLTRPSSESSARVRCARLRQSECFSQFEVPSESLGPFLPATIFSYHIKSMAKFWKEPRTSIPKFRSHPDFTCLGCVTLCRWYGLSGCQTAQLSYSCAKTSVSLGYAEAEMKNPLQKHTTQSLPSHPSLRSSFLCPGKEKLHFPRAPRFHLCPACEQRQVTRDRVLLG